MENQKSLGKKEIIERLEEWRENILCDINNEENWGTEDPDQFTYHITPKGSNAVDQEKLHVLHD